MESGECIAGTLSTPSTLSLGSELRDEPGVPSEHLPRPLGGILGCKIVFQDNMERYNMHHTTRKMDRRTQP